MSSGLLGYASMKKPAPQFSTLRFIFVAVVMMVLADHFIFGGERGYIEKARQDYYAGQAAKEVDAEMGPPVRVEPPVGEYFEAELPQPDEVVTSEEATEGASPTVNTLDPSTTLGMIRLG